MSKKRKIISIGIVLALALSTFGLIQAFAIPEGVYLIEGGGGLNCSNLYQADVSSAPLGGPTGPGGLNEL